MTVTLGSRIRLAKDEPNGPPEITPGKLLEHQLEELHERSFGWALTCCAWQEEEAADVLQAAYLKVFEGRAVFGGRSQFSTWFFGVVRLTAAEQRAKRLRRRLLLMKNPSLVATSVESHDAESCALSHPSESEVTRLRGALMDLPRRQREVLHLVFYSERSIGEAAEVMNVSIGTARTHYERGKKRLRQRLRGEDR